MHTKKQKKTYPPKAAAIRLTLLLFPMCTKPRARYQNSEPPNQRNKSRLGCRAQSLRSENRFLAWAPSALNNLIKVSWLNIKRKGLRKIEKSRWCSGARSLKSGYPFPAGPRALLRWFQSGRNRLGRMKKVYRLSNWHGGVMVKAVVHQAQGGEDRFPAGPRVLLSWFQRGRKGLESCNRFEELNK